MKKACVLLLVQLLVFGTAGYGATSDDVYVRKDVFEVYMQSINAKLDMIIEEQKAQRKDITELTKAVSVLSERVDRNFETLSGRIDGVNSSLSGQIDSLDKRIDDLRNGIYLWLVAIGLVIAWPKLQEKLKTLGKPTPSITLDDVRRLIEENNARMAGKAQA